MKFEPLKIPAIPRSVSGYKNDGTRDKRYKAGNTMAELTEYMEQASGKKPTSR